MTEFSAHRLPYGRHSLDEEDIAAVIAVLDDARRDGLLTQGTVVPRFEAAIAEAVDAPHVRACSSGTAALHLTALALDIGPGDWVVVPAVTFLATASAPRLAGAEVVFADVDSDTGIMGPAQLEAALRRSPKPPKAIFTVDFAGQCADPSAIASLACDCRAAVVEDACHALGTDYDAVCRTGDCRHATMTVFSFHPVKAIATGEGGAVTTRDPDLATRLARGRNHGMVREPEAFTQPELALAADGRPNPWYYEMPAPGFNYRMTDIQAALGISQLAKLKRFVDRRRHLARKYDEALRALVPIVRPLARVSHCDPAWHLYVVLIDFDTIGHDRASIMGQLRQRGIDSQVHYLPLHRQPYWRQRYGPLELPGAMTYYRKALSLPLFPTMTDADVERVVEDLAAVLGKPLR